MAKNWAITIGINKYNYLQPLNYAKRDAELMQQFLRTEAGFNKIFLFSDDSPEIGDESTRPTRSNLLRILRQLFQTPFMGAGDNFWFFFSGHGIRHAERDYLMPCDGDPEDIENTAIAINFVTERLRRCGADNVVLILDACRSLGTRAGEGIGRQTAEEARQQGVISIFSCSPQEYSYEIPELQQGAFTKALLEGLGIQGQCATVERLNQYLNYRVPEIVRQHRNARQKPYVIAEPVNKSHLILVPRYATVADIATLKNDAYRARIEGNINLAEQLWIRVLAAASGQDIEAVRALQEIGALKSNTSSSSTNRNVSPQTSAQQVSQPGMQAKQGQRKQEEAQRLYNQSLQQSVNPSLFHRWQTRLLLLSTVGVIVSSPFAFGLINPNAAGSIYFWILGYVAIFGLGWDILYDFLQKLRWDRDWPTAYQVLAGIWESVFVFFGVKIFGFLPVPVPKEVIPLDGFLFHYSVVWLAVFIVSKMLRRISRP